VGLMRASSASTTQQKWADLIRQHEQSGAPVKIFCQDRGVSEPSFYSWRKRLSASAAVRFALVDTNAPKRTDLTLMELVLSTGERLRIANGVDSSTLRTVLTVLRERA
jgi:hypothetical protein